MAGSPIADAERRARARIALEGLPVGDAIGQCFFRAQDVPMDVALAARTLPAGPWHYSDDTVMAVSVVEALERDGRVDQDFLAARFAERFHADEGRGYGAVAHYILHSIHEGRPWREVASSVYSGTGSLGNGAAMRVAPLGAWFADDERSLVTEAAASAAVTHAHPEGQAGAIAVALATSLAWRCRLDANSATPAAFIKMIASKTPDGTVREGLEKSIALLGASPAEAARELGDGAKVIAADTVPFAIWCAARSLQSFENAIGSALGGLLAPEADRDTVCAIVGGIVSVSAPVPVAWVSARETLE